MSNPPGYNPIPNGGSNPYGGQPYGQPSATPAPGQWQGGNGYDDQTVLSSQQGGASSYQPQSQPSAAQGWGQPQSQPSAGQNWNQSQTNYGQQSYQPQSQPSAATAYGQQQTYAGQQQAGFGTPPPAYNQGASNPAPVKKKSPWPWILGIGIPLLVAAIIAAIVLVVANQDTPQKAMRGYAQALIDGDANKALSYVDKPPTDKSMLTDAVLKDLKAKNNGVSAINNVGSGSMSLTVAGKPAYLTPKMIKSNGKYKLDVGTINGTGKFSIPFTVNGVKFQPGDVKIPLFPGVYDIKSANDNFEFTDDQTFDATSFGYAPTFFEDLKLSSAGETAARDATKKSLAACMAQHKLAPAGCPYAFSQPRDGVVDESTVTVNFDGSSNPVDTAKFETLLGNTTTSFDLPLKLHSTGKTYDGQPGSYNPSESFYARATVDLTQNPVKVTWK